MRQVVLDRARADTGDLARVDDDGYYFIVDRKKEMIIRGGPRSAGRRLAVKQDREQRAGDDQHGKRDEVRDTREDRRVIP